MAKNKKTSKKDELLSKHFDLMMDAAWCNRNIVNEQKQLVKLNSELDLLEVELNAMEELEDKSKSVLGKLN